VNTVKRRFLIGALKLLYSGVMAMSFGLATLLLLVPEQGRGVTPSMFLSMRIKLDNFVIFAALLYVWHLIFSACGFYQSRRLATRGSLVVDATKATTLATITLMAVTRLFTISMVTLSFLLLFWALSSASVALSRLALRYVLGRVRLQGHNLRHVLIVGTNSRAIEFARRIEARPDLGYRILGFVDDDWPDRLERLPDAYAICCNFASLSEYLRRNVVDEVAIYLPVRSFYETISRVAAICDQYGITARFGSDIFNLKVAHSYADDLDANAHITTFSGPPNGWPVLVKRALDIVISLTFLVLFAPLFAMVALLIPLTSDGPAVFRQERVGLNKRRFLIYKFRTMVANADKLLPDLELFNEVSGPVFKIKNDPRVTPVGRFLRRTSIDELPQLFNVLKGDMSMVGPRPLPVRDYEGFSEDWQRRRFSIRPGITCLWQINGRSSIAFEKWMQLDLQYMDEWSLWLDLKILARTVPAVWKGSGAA
jgi:exopolysaccharide biosynthesis polyprenyl glycosylphosphotransferase